MEIRETKPSGTRWTYAEFARLPSEGSTRYEVIDGELVVTPGPRPRHQRVVMRLILALGTFVREHDLGEIFPGPIDVLFGEGDYFEPDLVFVRRERAGIVSDRGLESAPDLVVEVASPSTAARDRGVKLERYRLFGVPEYWVADPEARSVTVWRLGAESDEPTALGPGDTLRWRPAIATGEGPSLALDVGELLAGG